MVGVRSNSAVLYTVPSMNEKTYRTGVVRTPHGFVWITWMDKDHTGARFIYAGREHDTQWRRAFTDIGLARAVGCWVWSIVRAEGS